MNTLGTFLNIRSSFTSLDLSELSLDTKFPFTFANQTTSVPFNGNLQTVTLRHSFLLKFGQTCSVDLREEIDHKHAIATMGTGDRSFCSQSMEKIATIWNATWKPVSKQFLRLEQLTTGGEAILLFNSKSCSYTRKCVCHGPSIQVYGTEERVGFQIIDESSRRGHMATMKLQDFELVQVLSNEEPGG